MGVDIYGIGAQETTGEYFANNWWSWRPIVMLIDVLNKEYQIGIPDEEIESLDTNSNMGISSPEHCARLADLLDEYVGYMRLMDYDTVYLNAQYWHSQDNVRVFGRTLTKLMELVPYGLLFVLPVIDGVTYKSNYATSVDNISRFAEFVRNCNGFKVN